MMEQMRVGNRPQNSGIILLSVGTYFFLTVTFQLAALHPVTADPRNRYSQLKWNLDPEQLLNLYYSRIPSYKQQRSNFVWQKRGPGSEFLGKRSDIQSIDKRVPGSEFLGKRVPGSEFLGKRVPGSEFLGKRVPGSEFLGKRVPGSEFLGKRVPGSEFLGKRVPGSEFLGKRVPGSEFLGKRVPGSEFLGKRVPGSEFLGKRVPGSEFLGKRVPGSEFLGKRVPGSEFLGKRSNIDYDNENVILQNDDDDINASDLTKLVKRSPEVAGEDGVQGVRNAFEASLH